MKTLNINWAGRKTLFWSLCLLLSTPFFALCIQSRYLVGLEEGGSTIGTWLGLFLILNRLSRHLSSRRYTICLARLPMIASGCIPAPRMASSLP